MRFPESRELRAFGKALWRYFLLEVKAYTLHETNIDNDESRFTSRLVCMKIKSLIGDSSYMCYFLITIP